MHRNAVNSISRLQFSGFSGIKSLKTPRGTVEG